MKKLKHLIIGGGVLLLIAAGWFGFGRDGYLVTIKLPAQPGYVEAIRVPGG